MSRGATNFVGSAFVLHVAERLAEAEQLGRGLSAQECGRLASGLRDVALRVHSLEATFRAADLISTREMTAAVTSLSIEDRRAIARSRLAEAKGTVVRLRPADGRRGRQVAADFVDFSGAGR